MASLTAEQAAHNLQVAIEAGELAIQQAPGGHPLFGALDNARQVLAWVNDNLGILPTMADGVLVRTRSEIEAATDAVYSALATLRNDPDNVPATIWPKLQALPWPWIAAGVGGLVLVGVLYQQRRRRR